MEMRIFGKLKWMFVLLLLGCTSLAYAAYPNAPTISTSGSATYTSIATAINSWKNAWTGDVYNPNCAYRNRTTIIDYVEATILAASKGTITDAEYDVLADALYFWLHTVAAEGTQGNDPWGGSYRSNFALSEYYFSTINTGGVSTLNCVWELTASSVPVTQYGPMLGPDTRLVLFTNLSESTIYRDASTCRVFFSTNGQNSKLIILGRKNHKITINGGKNFADPSSYTDVLNRKTQYTSTTGNEVILNSGNLLTAYTSFKQNVSTSAYCFYGNYHEADWEGNLPSIMSCDDGAAIAVKGAVKRIGLYKTEIKNNAINYTQNLQFGGGISFRDISSVAEGIYMNGCIIKGNFNNGHGGGLSCWFDGGNSSQKIVIRDTEFAYNCQADDNEHHGGGIFYRDTGRKMELYNCTFTNNYAHGATAGGAGISLEGHVTMKNCTFNGNYADNSFGGAIYTRPVFDSDFNNKVVDLKIDGCSFTNNQCVWTHNNTQTGIVAMQSGNMERGSGGAIMVDIFHGTFDDNASLYNIDVDITGNSTFTNNTADRNGGAIAVVMMGYTKLWSLTHGSQITSNLKITSATINGNHVTNKNVPAYTYSGSGGSVTGVSKNGGAIYLAHTKLTVNGGTIGASNNANYATLGGGAYINDANMIMTGGSLCYNNATNGGGVYIEKGNLSVTGGNINSNTASGNGGGGYISNGTVVVNGGQVNINGNGAVNGAGLFVNGASASCTLTSGNIQSNTATTSGGGLYMAGGSFIMQNGTMSSNVATNNDGGGAYISSGGTVTINGGTIQGNKATKGSGGGFFVNPGASKTTTINSNNANTTISSNQAKNGGGAYVNSGTLTVAATNSRTVKVQSNTASVNGGGLFVAGGTLNLTSALLSANSATLNGGGVYMSNGTINMNATIEKNMASFGGGFYMGGGTFNMNGGTVGGANANFANSATTSGGGLYMAGGSFVMQNGSMNYNTTSGNGGGIYVAGGSITYNYGTIAYNTATGNGGGIYANSNASFVGGTVNNNTAANGGGLYSASGTVDFRSGTFSQNAATGNGGGIYVASGSMVQLSGNAKLTKNHVPYASGENVGHGGGVYLAGQMKVGRNPGDPQGTHSLQVQDNYEGVSSRLNNIYLPTNENVIELLSDLRGSTGTKIGFSVNNGFRKVVYHNNDGSTTTSSWLHDLLGGTQGLTGVIFDDRQKYMAIHVLSSNETFDHNYIYLWGCWISAVDKDPESHTDEYPLPSGTAHHYTIADDGTWHIYTKEGLAWFSSYVNGLNEFQADYDEDVNAAAKAVMEADVDMSEFLWVPLGSAKSFTSASTSPTGSIFEDGHLFKGSFDGRGHVISGLDCRYINSIHNYGLFGKLVGEANVCNTFVDNYLYSNNEETDASGVYFMGGIAGFASGNTIISNCEARGRQSSPLSTVSVLGGIVGNLQDNATVHSSIGLPELAGVATTMGGIAGQTAAGTSIRNSYSNPKIGTVSGNVGGLVGTNGGTVENCYVRLQHATAPTNFYWFAAVNNGTVGCCYARNDAASDHYTTVTAATGSGTYGLTQLPYLYKHRDTQVAATNDYVPTGTDADRPWQRRPPTRTCTTARSTTC